MAVPKLKTVAKQATKKNASQIADKARRSYRNSLLKVERDIASGNLSPSQLAKANNIKDSLENSIQQSYATKTGEYLIEPERMLKNANIAKEMINSRYDDGISDRKNQLFQRDINQASVGGVSSKSREEVKIFYAMTKEYWEGSDISVRNKKIMAAFGSDNLEEVWDKVMSNEDAQKALDKAMNPSIEDGSGDVKEDIGSPEYIKELIVTRDTSRKKLIENE